MQQTRREGFVCGEVNSGEVNPWRRMELERRFGLWLSIPEEKVELGEGLYSLIDQERRFGLWLSKLVEKVRPGKGLWFSRLMGKVGPGESLYTLCSRLAEKVWFMVK